MKKLIDISDEYVRHMKVAAAFCNRDVKNYIQDILIQDIEKSILHAQNRHELKACKYLDPVIKEFEILGLTDKNLKLKVFTEGCAIFHIEDKDKLIHEISVINHSMDMFDEMTIEEILSSTPFYFSHAADGVRFEFSVTDTDEWKELLESI